MIMGSQEFDRRESRKRRRLSERRRVFGRMGLTGAQGESLASTDRSWSSSQQQQERSESPSSLLASAAESSNKISMKIQFHITMAPENEPLILDASHLERDLHEQQQVSKAAQATGASSSKNQNNSTDSTSIGEQIHERLLSRQNTLSTKRRQQLLALHKQPKALEPLGPGSSARAHNGGQPEESDEVGAAFRSLPDAWMAGSSGEASPASAPIGREHGARSSTITGGIADEATMKFLANHQKGRQLGGGSASLNQHMQMQLQLQLQRNSLQVSPLSLQPQSSQAREHIYFKRDGQRFGHEFTLKLGVERTYRCLLKVRPLYPLQSISIQGHPVLFVDCSQTSSNLSLTNVSSRSASSLLLASSSSAASKASSAPLSPTTLNRSWQNIHHNHTNQNQNHRRQAQQAPGRGLPHQQASDSYLLYQQQQSQMMRHFAASHCSSTNPHLGAQLIYMFDWSASRFEVNKNKARTQLQTVLKFSNGQILTLPLQVKFYQPECKQHLSWGNQLHFIDYDCSINCLGQINVDRIQYY